MKNSFILSKKGILLFLILGLLAAGALVMLGYEPEQKPLEIEIKPVAII